jgi:hypothetical protein
VGDTRAPGFASDTGVLQSFLFLSSHALIFDQSKQKLFVLSEREKTQTVFSVLLFSGTQHWLVLNKHKTKQLDRAGVR